MHEGLCEEWMVMIVIDDFPAFYYTEGGADLRVDAPAWCVVLTETLFVLLSPAKAYP